MTENKLWEIVHPDIYKIVYYPTSKSWTGVFNGNSLSVNLDTINPDLFPDVSGIYTTIPILRPTSTEVEELLRDYWKYLDPDYRWIAADSPTTVGKYHWHAYKNEPRHGEVEWLSSVTYRDFIKLDNLHIAVPVNTSWKGLCFKRPE